jgi:hypothetical protein
VKLYLSRRRDGLYQLTRLEPGVVGAALPPPTPLGVCEMAGCDGLTDAFPRPRGEWGRQCRPQPPADPLVFGGLCPVGAKLLLGRELGACEVARVVVTCSPVEQRPRA